MKRQRLVTDAAELSLEASAWIAGLGLMAMTIFGTIALWMAVKNKPGLSGFWFILSVSAKPQIVFYLPLLIGILLIRSYQADTIHPVPRKILFFFIPVMIGIGILWGWDSLLAITSTVLIGLSIITFFVMLKPPQKIQNISPK